MIFSKFFKSSWQNKDSNVRISAIKTELDISNDEHKSIVKDLLANDESELVRRAALLKLNDFDIWQQASEKNSNKKVRGYALNQVELIITDQHELKLSQAKKLSLLSQKYSSSFLEHWLKSETDPMLVIELYKKINKPQLLQSIFTRHQNADIQMALLELVNTKEQFEKLLKKSKIESVSQYITSQLNLLIEIEEKPKKIIKDVNLVLAKYQALKEVAAYQDFLAKKSELDNQWSILFTELNCLEEADKGLFISKLDNIKLQLEKLFSQKAEDYEQQKIVEALEQKKINAKHLFDEKLSAINLALSNSIYENNSIDNDHFAQELKNLVDQINDSVLDTQSKKSYLQQVESIQNKLNKLPDLAKLVTEATHLISKISQLALPQSVDELNQRYPTYQNWLNDWNEISKNAMEFLPESITKSYDEIISAWSKAVKPLFIEQKKSFTFAQRKLMDVKRLISSGKFNAAFGVFKKAETVFLNLNTNQQQKLQRDYQSAQEQINELSDWEHYIATPRKQELLTKIQLLVDAPLDNPSEQAEQVKAYRSQWNTLGHADDEIETTLNEEFNVACEQAFAPCRLFYAEQEKLREQHLIVRNSILDEVKTLDIELASNSVDWKLFENKVNQLNQKWRDAGEIERSKYQELNSQFHGLITPLRKAIAESHQEKILKKKQLLTKAEALLNEENIEVAIKETKALQIIWKEIGYCGVKDENKLWKIFRKINDQIFEKRDLLIKTEKASQSKKLESFTEELNKLENTDISTYKIRELKELINALENLKNNASKDSVSIKAIFSRIDSLKQKYEDEISELTQIKNQTLWKNIFSSLNHSIETELTELESFNQLPQQWQKKLKSLPTSEPSNDERKEKTILLEIMAGVDSPDIDKEKRLAIQVKLMQEQLNSKQVIDLEETFLEWLRIGKITKFCTPYLERLQLIFIN